MRTQLFSHSARFWTVKTERRVFNNIQSVLKDALPACPAHAILSQTIRFSLQLLLSRSDIIPALWQVPLDHTLSFRFL